jgi:hypothetical protein
MVEKPFAWLIRAGLNRTEFAPQVELAMEDNVRNGPNGREAPALYDISLSKKDYASFGHDKGLEKHLSSLVIRLAPERGYQLGSNVVIHFREDASVLVGQMRVAAYFAENDKAPDSLMAAVENTVSIGPEELKKLNDDLAQAQGQAETLLPPAWLTLYRPTRGQPMRLLHSPIHIGRHLSNEIIVNDRRVSRHHAEIRFERDQFILYDLSSTNGVKINGVATRQPVPLRNNDVITVGSHEFVFQRR